MRNQFDRSTIRLALVATKLPEGKVLYQSPGVSENASRLEVFARTCGDCPAEIFIVPAESVGLEWHEAKGKAEWGDEFRKKHFCVLVHAAEVTANVLD